MANQKIIPIMDIKEQEAVDNKLRLFESGGMASGSMVGAYLGNVHDMTSLGVIGVAEFLPTYFLFHERDHSPLAHYGLGFLSTALALKFIGKLDFQTLALTTVGMVGGCYGGSALADKF